MRAWRAGGSFLLKLEQGASVPERPVLPAEACFMAADILADREARMAAFHDRELMNLPFRYACKTGTSSPISATTGAWASPVKSRLASGWAILTPPP